MTRFSVASTAVTVLALSLVAWPVVAQGPGGRGTGNGPPEGQDGDHEVVVRPSTMSELGWIYIDEGAAGFSAGALESGPGTPPLGGGSAGFAIIDTSGGMSLQNFDGSWIGLPVSSITRLEYCTYVTANTGVQDIAFQLNFDDDVTDADIDWKGRLVFEPYQTPGNVVILNQWQCWDALDGNWWATGAPVNGLAPQSDPKTISMILGSYPNAGINSKFGGILFKAGSGWPVFDGNADALVIGIDGVETTFNFESEPAAKGDCKGGGWQQFGFANQGQCVSYFNRNVK